MITAITPDIVRLQIPFEDIYTTVFAVKTPQGALLFDTATYPTDADDYILPLLSELGIDAPEMIFISHPHRDHAGSLARLTDVFAHAQIISRSEKLRAQYANAAFLAPEDGDTLLGVLRVVTLPGHTADAIALFDTRTNTLLTGDGLQAYGIYGSGAWGANISFIPAHLDALEKLRALPIQTLVAAHDYHPCGYIARGRDEIDRYLDACADALRDIAAFIRVHPEMDDKQAADAYNAAFQLPTVGAHVFTGARAAMEKGVL